MSTLHEIKAAAAILPAEDRYALAEWIEQGDDIQALRRDEIIREINLGMEQADRGELMDADEVFARLRANRRAGA